MATGRAGEQARAEVERVAGAAADMHQAMSACDFALVVWQLPAGVVVLANQPAADLFGLSIEQLMGVAAVDLAEPADGIRRTLALIAGGILDDTQANRGIRLPDGTVLAARVWTRAIEVDGQRAAASVVVPVAELGRLGRDPAAPWRGLSRVAVGVADTRLRVVTVSDDVRDVLGMRPDALVGRSLLDVMEVSTPLLTGAARADTTVVHLEARFRRDDSRYSDVCILVGEEFPDGRSRVPFALSTAPTEPLPANDRIAELERRLRIIGGEVRAAGLLEGVPDLPSVIDRPQLRELTSRQWDILSRLLRGDRVATMAEDLYISPSTVRNHLGAIFEKFGVHSQAELLAALRAPRP
jgi:DNA-binding CsgD family transcriptional regulator